MAGFVSMVKSAFVSDNIYSIVADSVCFVGQVMAILYMMEPQSHKSGDSLETEVATSGARGNRESSVAISNS